MQKQTEWQSTFLEDGGGLGYFIQSTSNHVGAAVLEQAACSLLDVAIGEQIEALIAHRIVEAPIQGHALKIVGQIAGLLLHVLLVIYIMVRLAVRVGLLARRSGLLILIVVIVGVIVLIISIGILVVTLSVAVLHVVTVILVMTVAGRFRVPVWLVIAVVVIIQQLLLLRLLLLGWRRSMLIIVVLRLVAALIMVVRWVILVCRCLIGQVGMMTVRADERTG